MSIKEKIKVLFRGIIMPTLIFVGITIFLTLIMQCFHKKDLNATFIQGIADIILLFILFPIYLSFIKSENVERGKFAFRVCLFMIPLSFSICLLSNILIDILPIFKDTNEVSEDIEKLLSNTNIIFVIILVGISIPIIEELLFRGFFYVAIEKVSNSIIAIIISSMLFALAHGNLEQGAYAFFAGLFLSYVRYKYKSIIYTIIMHFFMNLTSLVFVNQVTTLTDLRSKMFILFISIAILIFTLIRINTNDKIKYY